MSNQKAVITKFLEAILPPDLHHLIGDLEEEFNLNKEREGLTQARWYFWSQLIRSFPWFFVQSLTWNMEMIYNYLKVTWRNLKKHTGFSLINVLGLGASMSVCLLIILFLIDQRSYDRFHSKSDRIVRVTIDFKSPSNNESSLYATTPASLAEKLSMDYPEVEKALQIRGNYDGEFKHGEKVIPLQGFYADSDFLSVFDFKLISGDRATALNEPGQVLLTPESAQKLFGDEAALGKTITGLGDRDYVVSGVVNDDVRTHFNFEIIASHKTLEANTASQEMLNSWTSSIYDSYTYLLMKKGADTGAFEEKIQTLIASDYSDPEEESVIASMIIQPLTKINLGPALSNEIGMVVPNFFGWVFIGFAIIIILIAGFNYVSLTIARSLNRGKEVGVRKVLGAHRMSVIKQFLFESVVITIIALGFAVLILRFLLPEFNSLFFISFTENQIEMDLLANYGVIAVFICFSIMVGVFAGIYPSIYLSSFQPASVLKGIFSTGSRLSGQTLKKILTVGQFTFSLIFIITSFILFQQFKFMGETDYGFNRENIVNIALQDISLNQLKYELENMPEVQSVAGASVVPAMGSIRGVWLESDLTEDRLRAHSFLTDENYIQTMGLNLMAGRNFNPETSMDTAAAVIISDQAVTKLGFEGPQDALTKQVSINDENYEVVGVIENFISADPMRSGDPIVMLYRPDITYYAVVKTKAGSTGDFLQNLEESWLTMNSLYSLKYKVFDEQLKESPQLIVFVDFIKILGLIAGFSILISCLGLLGMAMYSAENRVKEIGIRKVLGASVQNIVVLLSKEYLLLIAIALSIGIPLSWFINNLWMQLVTNKVGLQPAVFVLGSIAVLGLAVLTIGSQAFKAARTNSIENLRSE